MRLLDTDLQLIKSVVNSIDWNIHHVHGHELAQMRENYGDTEPNYTRDHLLDLVRKKAKLSISSDSDRHARLYFHKMHRHFLFNILLEKAEDAIFCNICERLFHLLDNEDRMGELTAENLNNLLLCLKDYLRLYGFSISHEKVEYIDGRIQSVCKSVLTLKRECLAIYKIEDGNVWIEVDEFERIGHALKSKMSSFGGIPFLGNMCSALQKHKKFDTHFKRYLFPVPTSQMNGKLDATVPWGYLFNLALQYPNDGDSDDQKHPHLWRDIIVIGTALVSALDVEPYSTWDTEFKAGSDAVKMMADISLLESNFRLPQVRFSDLLPLMKGCFSWTKQKENSDFELSYSDLNYFLNKLLKYLSSPNPCAIKIQELRTEMRRLSEEKFRLALDVFAHRSPPNQSFSSPADHSNVDAFFKPLIPVDDETILAPCPPYSCYAALEAICAYYRTKIKNFDELLGGHLETFVRQRISNLNISAKNGEYRNSEGDAGEIDAALEFDDLIVLIEIKKKSFTRRARSGYWDSVLIDIHQSLLDSQHQALGHEYSLEKDRRIIFNDASILELRNRPIEKITLVLFDYGAIQDRTIIRQLLPMYMQCRFSSPDEKLNNKFKELNARCEQFNKRYSAYSSLFEEPPNIPFFGSWFFSIPQFLVLLDGIKDPSELKKTLWNTRHMTAKTLDWYYEQSYMDGIKNPTSKT